MNGDEMTYRIEQFVRKISSPVIVKTNTEEKHFKNGSELADYSFDRRYIVTDICTNGQNIIITLAENDNINDTNWVGEIQEGFL
ncbi:MAG: hypothetical protein IKP95_05740 [Ruminococcus sp.]|nr:hypothetical protein [Ruminococcus sp.]